jgi:hypothetical protein
MLPTRESAFSLIPVEFTYVNKKKMILNMEITYVNQKKMTLLNTRGGLILMTFSSGPSLETITCCSQSSGVYICKSIVNYLRHGNYMSKLEGNYLTYEHRIEIPVEFTYVNQ